MPHVHLRVDEHTALALRDAERREWDRLLPGLVDLPPSDGVPEVQALAGVLRRWTAAEVPRPRTGLGVVAAGAGLLLYSWSLPAPPWLALLAVVGVIGGLGVDHQQRRRRDPAKFRAAALLHLQQLGQRTLVLPLAGHLVEVRGYRPQLRRHREALSLALDQARAQAEAAGRTLHEVKDTNVRLRRPAEDDDTRRLASLRERLLAEVRATQATEAELDRRLADLDSRFTRAALLGERLAAGERADGLVRGGASRAREGMLAELEDDLQRIAADVGALSTLLESARARLEASRTASDVAVSEARRERVTGPASS